MYYNHSLMRKDKVKWKVELFNSYYKFYEPSDNGLISLYSYNLYYYH